MSHHQLDSWREAAMEHESDPENYPNDDSNSTDYMQYNILYAVDPPATIPPSVHSNYIANIVDTPAPEPLPPLVLIRSATAIKTEPLPAAPPAPQPPPTSDAAYTIKHEPLPTQPPMPQPQSQPPAAPATTEEEEEEEEEEAEAADNSGDGEPDNSGEGYASDHDMFAEDEDSDEDLLARAEAQVLVNRTLLEASDRPASVMGRMPTVDDDVLGHFHVQHAADDEGAGVDAEDDNGVLQIGDASDDANVIVNTIDLSAEITPAAASAAAINLHDIPVGAPPYIYAPPLVFSSSYIPARRPRSNAVVQSSRYNLRRYSPPVEISDGDDDDDVVFVMQVRPAIVPIVDLSAMDDSPQPTATAAEVASRRLQMPMLVAEDQEQPDDDPAVAAFELMHADDAAANNAAAAGADVGVGGVPTQVAVAVNHVLEQELADFDRECERVRDRQHRAERTAMRAQTEATLAQLRRQQSIVEATETAARRAVEEVRREADQRVQEARNRAEAAERDQMAGGRVIHCAVCLESAFAHQPASTVCGHVFCRACIEQAIRVNRKCPLCNRKLSMRQVHALYV